MRTQLSLRYRLPCLLALLIAVGCAGTADAVSNDIVIFDTEVLKGRGIDPDIAELFSHQPRFMPGVILVQLKVNGDARGRIKARFDDTGKLCADDDFLRQAGIHPPTGFQNGGACLDLQQIWPRAVVKLDPEEGKVDLVVPTEALTPPEADSDRWQHGGSAGILNYDTQYLTSSGNGAGDFIQAATEMGFNAGDWIFRSRQMLTRYENADNFSHLAAYAQRTFGGIKKVFQAGQISLSNSLFGTGQVLGFQLFPESALTSGQGGAGLVEGVADTQSVVEVRQSGVLLYTTAVPAGPFRLQGFSLLNTHSDLQVSLSGSNGQKRQFIVPAATLLARIPLASPGLSFGAGRLDQQGSKSPILGTIASGWQLTPFTTLSAGVLGSTLYRAGSVNLDSQLFTPTRLSLQSTLAQDAEHHNSGSLISAILSQNLSEVLSTNINGRLQTPGYRELSDSIREDTGDQTRNHSQWGAGISWFQDMLGTLSFSWAHSTMFTGSSSSYLRGSWSRQFGQTYFGISCEHDTNSYNGHPDDRVYVSLSLPLGEGRDINSYLNSSRSGNRTGVRYSDRTTQAFGWSLSSERDFSYNHNSLSGNLDYITPVSQLDGSLTHDSDSYTSFSVHASGGVVFHNKGITLSPYRISDTFGIAQVGNESGVRLTTPAGPVWTDTRGYAVLPTLNGYRRSGIQLDTRSLEKNVDVGNAWQEADMARGAIGWVTFNVIHSRRVLVETVMGNGEHLPHGATVFDKAGNLVTVVGDDGTVFVPDAAPDMLLEVQNSGHTVCKMKLSLPEKPPGSVLYENSRATCQ